MLVAWGAFGAWDKARCGEPAESPPPGTAQAIHEIQQSLGGSVVDGFPMLHPIDTGFTPWYKRIGEASGGAAFEAFRNWRNRLALVAESTVDPTPTFEPSAPSQVSGRIYVTPGYPPQGSMGIAWPDWWPNPPAGSVIVATGGFQIPPPLVAPSYPPAAGVVPVVDVSVPTYSPYGTPQPAAPPAYGSPSAAVPYPVPYGPPVVASPYRPGSAPVDALRRAAKDLDASANRLESQELYDEADEVRELAQRFRVKARERARASVPGMPVPVTSVVPGYAPSLGRGDLDPGDEGAEAEEPAGDGGSGH